MHANNKQLVKSVIVITITIIQIDIMTAKKTIFSNKINYDLIIKMFFKSNMSNII